MNRFSSCFSTISHSTCPMTTLTEADAAHAALGWFAAQGWRAAHGLDITPGSPANGAKTSHSKGTTHGAHA